MEKRQGWLRWLIALVALVLVAAACGGGRDDDEGGDDGGSGEEGGAPASVPGFDGETIRLGVITPTSGPVAVIGEPLTNGDRAYWDYVNEELGGVGGEYPVELVVEDSAYDAPTAVQKYNQIKGDVVLFNQLLGTPIVNALLEQLQADDIVAQPASLDSFWVREQNLLPIGAPYQIQAINGVHWYVTEGGGSESSAVCTLGQDDPYGEAGQEGVDFALAELGFAPRWMGQSPTWIGAFVESELLPYLEANFTWVAEGPEYGDESVPGMSELIRIQETYTPDQEPDVYFNFGYNESKAVHQVLEEAVAQGDLSREGIIEAMNSIEALEFDGVLGEYGWGGPDDRDPPRAHSIFEVDSSQPIGLGLIAQEHEAP